MLRKTVSGTMLFLLLVSTLTLAYNIQSVRAEPRTWIVDDDGPADFHTIKSAVENANVWDTIVVRNGIYTENIVVDKDHLVVKSENGPAMTLVRAENPNSDVFGVSSDYVEIDGFTIEGAVGDSSNSPFGISVVGADYYNILHNSIRNNFIGVLLEHSNYGNVEENYFTLNYWIGMNLVESNNFVITGNALTKNVMSISVYHCSGSTFTQNDLVENTRGLALGSGSNNVLYLNNFINNDQYNIYSSFSTNLWNSPEKMTYAYDGRTFTNYLGNYWSDYTDVDVYSGSYQNEAGSDGIWDHPYAIEVNDQDNYPLVNPWTETQLKFRVGDQVRTTANLNVREGPGLGYDVIDTLSEGNFGEIVGGPVESDGYIWWEIDYAVGTRGWSVEEGLEIVVQNQRPNKPTDVAQYRSDGVTVIPEGDRTPESTVVFKGVVSDPDGDLVRFEIELRKIDEAFVGNPTSVSEFTLNSIEMEITCPDLSYSGYHWQYRAKDATGATSDWTEFAFYGLDVDFTVYFDNQPPDTIIRIGPSGTVNQNDVTFDWMGVDDSSALPNLQFQYFLQNYDYDWSDWSYRENVQYADLPDGDYTFKVRARDESLNVDPTPDERSFSVSAPPFTFSPESPKSGDMVTFTATNQYPLIYEWDFGDGTVIETSEPHANHRFRGAIVDPDTHEPRSRDYNVKLTTQNKYGEIIGIFKLSVTIEPLTKRVELSPTYLGTPYMEATYNWVGTDEATGEDLYIVSRIDTRFGGALGASQFFIARRTSPSPSLPEVIWYIPWPTEWAWNSRTYHTPFTPSLQQELWGTTCQLTKITYPDDGTFEGISVTATSFMVMIATGAQITIIQTYWDGGWARFDPSSPAERLIPEDMQTVRDLAGILDLLKKFIELAVLSPCELRIYDSQGRVTGLVNGEEKEQIPGSIYFNNTVVVLYSNETYWYELVGTGQGVYGLRAILVDGTETTTFTAADIPTSLYTVHSYTIDWAALSQGGQGVTVKVDSDGNGLFEYAFISDSELTQTEYVIATDDAPPETQLKVGESKLVINGMTYLTSPTPIELTTEDNAGGSGVASTAYRIHNASYDSGWKTYTDSLLLIGLSDGVYYIDYNSTDYAGNVELTHTIKVTLFSWNYIFEDTYGRGTTLKINIAYKFFQFITPDKDYGIIKATYMQQSGRSIIIAHLDKQLQLITTAVDTKLDFCVATAWDRQTRKQYFLMDKPGIEK